MARYIDDLLLHADSQRRAKAAATRVEFGEQDYETLMNY